MEKSLNSCNSPMWQVACGFSVCLSEDTSYTIRLLAKFELPTRASNKTRVKLYINFCNPK